MGHTIESLSPERQITQDKLQHHYMLDETAANELAGGSSDTDHIDELLSYVEGTAEAVEKRDKNRQEILDIQSGTSDKQLIIVGPCSLDNETNYTELLDYIEALQEEHPNAHIALRANAAKPRSSGGYRGLYHSVANEDDRKKSVDVYKDAFERGIAIMTEITTTNEFIQYAPYLSAAWLGARDMLSTDLRSTMSATRMAIFLKNAQDGKTDTVKKALQAVRKSSKENDESGVDLGHLGSRNLKDGMPRSVTVGQGNRNLGIIARGYPLPKEMDKEHKEQAMLQHLGQLCTLAHKENTIVIIDGGHDVPPMLDIEKDVEDRFPKVIDIIFRAIEDGRVEHAERMAGIAGEIGTKAGNTDLNMPINPVNKKRIGGHIRKLRQIRQIAQGMIA